MAVAECSHSWTGAPLIEVTVTWLNNFFSDWKINEVRSVRTCFLVHEWWQPSFTALHIWLLNKSHRKLIVMMKTYKMMLLLSNCIHFFRKVCIVATLARSPMQERFALNGTYWLNEDFMLLLDACVYRQVQYKHHASIPTARRRAKLLSLLCLAEKQKKKSTGKNCCLLQLNKERTKCRKMWKHGGCAWNERAVYFLSFTQSAPQRPLRMWRDGDSCTYTHEETINCFIYCCFNILSNEERFNDFME